MNKLYVNPNMNPKYFYPLLKPLTLIYDQLIIWSPVGTQLERYSFSQSEFLEACQSGAIIPAGRHSWFNQNDRQQHPDEDSRQFDPGFDGRLADIAKSKRKILSTSVLPVGYHIADEILDLSVDSRDEEQRNKFKVEMDALRASFTESMQERIEIVAKQQIRSPQWAVLNSYVQDVLATMQLQATSTLIDLDHAIGYQYLADNQSGIQQEQLAQSIARIRDQLSRGEKIPELPKGLDGEALTAFLNDISSGLNRPWSKIAEKRKYRGSLRRWLHRTVDQLRPPVSGATLSETAKKHAQKLHDDAQRKVSLATPLPSAILLGLSGTAEATGIGAAISYASRFFFQTQLVKVFAKYLGNRTTRFLVDTPFFDDAETNNPDGGDIKVLL